MSTPERTFESYQANHDVREMVLRLETALRELLDASPTSCEDRALNEAQRRAEEVLRGR